MEDDPLRQVASPFPLHKLLPEKCQAAEEQSCAPIFKSAVNIKIILEQVRFKLLCVVPRIHSTLNLWIG